MSSKFCSNCGNQLASDALFCSKCGFKQDGSGQPSNKAIPPPQYAQGQPMQGYPQPNAPNQGYMGGFPYQRNQYTRPPNYVFTQTMMDRIKGTLKRDIHVIEEIEERKDLQDEANKLLLSCFAIIAALQIIYTFTLDVDNLGAEILYIILSRFIGGYAFIYLIAAFGKSIGGRETQTDTQEIVRVTSYAYVARVIDETLFSLIEVSASVVFLWLVAVVYSAIVFITVVRRALDKGIGTALLTIILAGIGSTVVNAVFLLILV